MIKATIFGILPDVIELKKSDQQRLPIVYIIGPKKISWYIAVFTVWFPGVGLRDRLNRENFIAQ